MNTPLSSRLLDPAHVRARLVATVAAVALLGLLSQGASAQDNDDDGVLPVAGSSAGEQATPGGNVTGNGSGGGNGSGSEQHALSTAVQVAGDLQDELDPAVGTLEFESEGGGAVLVTDAPAEEAAFVAHPPGIAAGDNGTGPALQGRGLLTVSEGLQVRLAAAQSSTQSLALLVLAKDGPTLEAELAGATKPALIVSMGATTSVDLNKLAATASKYATLLPGYHATVVFLSVESGVLHTSAARAHTAGGPLDVLTR